MRNEARIVWFDAADPAWVDGSLAGAIQDTDFFGEQSGPVVDLAGSATVTTSASGTAVITMSLAATAATTFSATAAMGAVQPLAGASAYSYVAAGSIGALAGLGGTAATVFSATGAARSAIAMAGAASASSAATGAARLALSAAGSAATTFYATGTMGSVIPVGGTAGYTYSAGGAAKIDLPLAAAGGYSFSATGGIGALIPIAGESSVTYSATGTIGRVLGIDGSAAYSFDATGLIEKEGLKGAGLMQFTADAALSLLRPEGSVSWDDEIEAGYTAIEILRLVATTALGHATGLGGGAVHFESMNGAVERVTATLGGGNRTITNRDVSGDSLGSGWGRQVDGVTAAQVMRLLASFMQGNATGLNSGNATFYSLDGSKPRIIETYVNGERTLMSVDAD